MAFLQTKAAAAWGAYMPWANGRGQFELLRAMAFALVMLPCAFMLGKYYFGFYSPKVITDIIRESGDWSLRFLVASLALTPFARYFSWPALIDVRRMVGLASLFYALAHIYFYCLDLHFMWLMIGSEIINRLFLTIGALATLGLIVLGVTSNDWSVRRLGVRLWRQIHVYVYAITILGLLHYLMEVRLDAYEAILLSGCFMLLMTYRVMRARYGMPHFALWILMSAFMGLATAVLEASYYGLATRFGFWRVLNTNLIFAWPLRPAYWVFVFALVVSVITALRQRKDKKI